jgi:5'-3' exonuclease
MAAGSPKLYLIDGTAQLFRAYYALPGLTGPDGLPTGAVFGFTSMLRKLIKEEGPAYLAVAWDLPGEVFRHESFEAYKANRDPTPEDLDAQLPYAREVCEALGVAAVEREGYEADDLIATYTRLGREAGHEVVVVSSDKDLLQLVGEGVSLLNPKTDARLDAAAVAESFGVPPERVIDVLGLMGDAVDNIPGVPGVGEKTALAVVGTYGEVESVIARAARFTALYDARDVMLGAIAGLEGAPRPEGVLLDRLRAAAGELRTRIETFVEAEADEAMRDRAAELVPLLAAVDVAALGADGSRTGRQAARPLRELKRELKALDRGSGRRIWYAIVEHAAQARMSRELATLEAEVPVERALEDLRLREPDRARAADLFRTLGFRTLTEEFSASAGVPDEPTPAVEQGRGNYTTVLDGGGLAALVERCTAAGRFAVDTETDGLDPMRACLVGIPTRPARGPTCRWVTTTSAPRASSRSTRSWGRSARCSPMRAWPRSVRTSSTTPTSCDGTACRSRDGCWTRWSPRSCWIPADRATRWTAWPRRTSGTRPFPTRSSSARARSSSR